MICILTYRCLFLEVIFWMTEYFGYFIHKLFMVHSTKEILDLIENEEIRLIPNYTLHSFLPNTLMKLSMDEEN